jgi:catechol-2,3-dioxygenase
LNTRQRKRGAVPHTFIQIGGKRMGVYLQSEERPPPVSARGLPTYSFTTAAQGLDSVINRLRDLGSIYDGPIGRPYPFAEQSLFFTDPAGNHYAVFTPVEPRRALDESARMTGVGYIELEAPDLAASVDFYEKVLGFQLIHRREDLRQTMLTMASGQTLILTTSPFSAKGLVMSRKVPGPHIAFYVPGNKWSDAMAHLDRLGIPHGDRGAAKERHAGQGGTYMDDPAGYVIQFITDGME